MYVLNYAGARRKKEPVKPQRHNRNKKQWNAAPHQTLVIRREEKPHRQRFRRPDAIFSRVRVSRTRFFVQAASATFLRTPVECIKHKRARAVLSVEIFSSRLLLYLYGCGDLIPRAASIYKLWI